MSRFWDIKNKSQSSGKKSHPKKLSSIHQLLPRIHHNLTIEKPSQSTQILQNPQQKHHPPRQKKTKIYFATHEKSQGLNNKSFHPWPDSQATGGRQRLEAS
jgi:hypothetical protein